MDPGRAGAGGGDGRRSRRQPMGVSGAARCQPTHVRLKERAIYTRLNSGNWMDVDTQGPRVERTQRAHSPLPSWAWTAWAG